MDSLQELLDSPFFSTLAMSSEQCAHRLQELMRIPGNSQCADCGTEEPEPNFVSLNLGLFICIKCSGYHRALGTRFSVTKSILLDTFDDAKVKQMEAGGNMLGVEKWQVTVPKCWPIVDKHSPDDLIEQWIRAKYERQEFTENQVTEELRPYCLGSKYGFLMKKKKKDSKWQRRFFVLSAEEGYLKMYIKQGDNEPKHKISISGINLMMVHSDVTGEKHSMLITFPIMQNNQSKQRHIYVYADKSFEIVDWYLTIRGARLKFLTPYLYEVERPVVDFLQSRKFIKSGYLHKTGGKDGDSWRKRYVCVDFHRFLYFEKALDSEPIGEVSIEKAGMECFVMEGIDGNHPQSPSEHCFMVRAHENSSLKGRKPTYNFCAASREDLNIWMSAFRKGMEDLNFLSAVKETDKRQSLMSNFSRNSSYAT